MESFIVKFYSGDDFMSMYRNREDLVPDRIVSVNGVKIEEMESITEMLAMKVFKEKIANIYSGKVNVGKLSNPIANAYIYDIDEHYISGISMDFSKEEVITHKYSKESMDTLGQYK